MKKVSITKLNTLLGHTGSIYTLHQIDGGRFLSAGGDGMIAEWNPDESENAKLISKVNAHIFSLQFLPNQNLLLAAEMNGGIHVLDLQRNKEIKHLAYHNNGVFDLCLSANGQYIYAAGGDGVLSIWSTKFDLLHGLQISSQSLRSIDLHPTKNEIAVGSTDHSTYILDADPHKILCRLRQHKNSVFSVCYSPDGEYLLSGSRDAQLSVWSAHDYELLHSVPAHLSTINHIAFHPTEKIFATASRDKTIKIWDAENFELLKVIDKEKLDGHTHSVNRLTWLDADRLVSCSDDRSIMIWSVN